MSTIERFRPFVSSSTKMKEFSLKALFTGILLGLFFAIGNAYLGLKVGTTVSASIPAAVIAMALLRISRKPTTVLEYNMVQTVASVGEGLTSGIIFTVPALFLMGESPSCLKISLLAALGGILGVLFMIPMRRYIIVQEHKSLPFPEGTACAEILKTTHEGSKKALLALIGIAVGAIYKTFINVFSLFKEIPSWTIKSYQSTQISIDCTPSLMGVGFIIGPRIASILFAGGALAWWVMIPLIKMFAGHEAVIYPGTTPIATMDSSEIWSTYIRYIGAGAVAAGGIISLFKIAPLISKTLRLSFLELFQRVRIDKLARVEKDISLKWLILGSIAILLALWLTPAFHMNFVTVSLLILLGFFFVAVTSITVGIVGSTSNPASGMTITTLIITCLIFIALGWTERIYLLAALTMSCMVNVAITMAATTSQDLKTGFLLGATPRSQQIGEILGVVFPAAAIGFTILLLDKVYVLGSAAMPAPQGTMMSLIAKGVIHGDIPITLVTVGVLLGIIVEILRLPVLPFAIGLYLPLSLNIPILIGGVIHLIVKKWRRPQSSAIDNGILAASGLVAGDACMGVVIALLTVLGWISIDQTPKFGDAISLLSFLLIALFLGWISLFYTKKE